MSFKLADTAQAHEEARELFETVRVQLAAQLPSTADVRHIGATAIPGCLTKGDVDIVVRIPPPQFAEAESMLAAMFDRNEGSIRTEEFAAFEDSASRPHLGVQLAAIGGPFDFFHLFVEAMRRSPELVEAYNALKRRHDGANMASYRKAKDAFIADVLGQLDCK